MSNALAHIALYGPPGTGKSELAASIPGVKLIALFDPLGHGGPYLRRYANKRTRDVVIVRGQPSIIDTIDSYSEEAVVDGSLREDASLRSKLWHFGANAEGKAQWDIKRTVLVKACAEINASVFIFDSLTLFTTSMRVLTRAQGITDAEQAAYAMTDYVEDLCIALASLPITTVLIAHVSNRNVKFRKEIITVDNQINAPGRMSRNIKSMFSNVWYCSVDDDGKYLVQTSTIGDHEARNTVNAEPVCEVPLGGAYEYVTRNAKPLLWIS